MDAEVGELGVSAVEGGAGLLLVRAVDEVASAAGLALAAVAVEVTDPHPVPDVPHRHSCPDGIDDACELMARHDRYGGIGERIAQRTADRDLLTDIATRDAQLTAINRWGIPDRSQLQRLHAILQPTFVANGDNDSMMQTANSHLLAKHLPEAQLRIYADAGHGFLDQEPTLFAAHVGAFLDGG